MKKQFYALVSLPPALVALILALVGLVFWVISATLTSIAIWHRNLAARIASEGGIPIALYHDESV